MAKFRVKQDVTVAIGAEGADQTFKAGQHEVTEHNRAALERLAELGYAELAQSSSKEE